MNPEISRREFLKLSGATLILAACGNENTLKSETDKTGIVKLNEYINSLPNSDLKTALTEKVLPIFEDPNTGIIEIGGIDVPISSSSIKTSLQNVQRFDGEIYFYDNESPIMSKVKKEEDFQLVLPYFNTSEDPPEFTYERGTGVAIPLKTNEEINSSIAPKITATTPDRSKIKIDNKHFQEMEKFIYIKEAFSMLFFLEYYEMIIDEMQRLDLPTEIETIREDGKTTSTNAVSPSINRVINTGGRLLAVIDLAGYFLMFKTLMNSETESYMNNYPSLRDGSKDVAEYLKLTKITDPIRQAIDWALTSHGAKNLGYKGDLSKPY